MPLRKTATSMQASTRGTTRRWIGSMPNTIIASSSSRILRAPRSAAMAEPPAPAMSSDVAIGPASRTTARTEAEPTNDWAPNCLIRPPTWSAITAPNGMATSAVGMIVTEAMNHACCRNSRVWKGRRNSPRKTSRPNAKSLPAAPTGARAREAVRDDIASGPRAHGHVRLERAGGRSHAVLAAPLAGWALAAARDPVGRLLLERDRRERRQLAVLLGLELVGVLLLRHSDGADPLGVEEL